MSDAGEWYAIYDGDCRLATVRGHGAQYRVGNEFALRLGREVEKVRVSEHRPHLVLPRQEGVWSSVLPPEPS